MKISPTCSGLYLYVFIYSLRLHFLMKGNLQKIVILKMLLKSTQERQHSSTLRSILTMAFEDRHHQTSHLLWRELQRHKCSSRDAYTSGVNFINVKHTNLSYKHCFSSFF